VTSGLVLLEREALDAIEPRWRRQGYRIVRDPSGTELPEFLQSARPDAIAVGGPQNVVIEVLVQDGSPQSAGKGDKITKLNQLMAGHPDWRLEVVYAPKSEAAPPAASAADISARAKSVGAFAQQEPAGALLLAWSLLEAVARVVEPQRAARALAPGAIGELLVGLGHLEQRDGETLRETGRLRNAIAHGDLSVQPTPAHVDAILDLVERLLRPDHATLARKGA
jgi:hypothetical protein